MTNYQKIKSKYLSLIHTSNIYYLICLNQNGVQIQQDFLDSNQYLQLHPLSQKQFEMKQINKVTSIVLDCQTKTNTGSNDHQIYINELNDHNPCSTEYNLSENDYKTLKLANALIISNLFEMVFIVFGCTLIYMTIYYKWSPEFRVSLQLFILSDVIIALEKAFFFYTLINKDKKLKICLCLNMSSMMLKLVASGVLSDLSSGLLLQQLSKNFDFFHAKIKNTIENYVFIIVPLCFSKFFGKDYLTKNQSFICQKSKSIYVKP